MKICRGKILMVAGAVLLIAALFLMLYNRGESSRAKTQSSEILSELKEQMPPSHQENHQNNQSIPGSDIYTVPNAPIFSESLTTDTHMNIIPEPDLFEEYEEYVEPNTSETVYYVKEIPCMGVISIPSLGIELPVIADWSYSDLRVAPCRYYGSIQGGDMVIAAHNYRSHFGRISELHSGDEIIFTDGDGLQHKYSVVQSEIISGNDRESMITHSDQWDITLFTCTLSGASRVTVRAVSEDHK
ncbi:MAG: sortase [Ruminococcus sp.]